jgi:hypothetical protein
MTAYPPCPVPPGWPSSRPACCHLAARLADVADLLYGLDMYYQRAAAGQLRCLRLLFDFPVTPPGEWHLAADRQAQIRRELAAYTRCKLSMTPQTRAVYERASHRIMRRHATDSETCAAIWITVWGCLLDHNAPRTRARPALWTFRALPAGPPGRHPRAGNAVRGQSQTDRRNTRRAGV